MNPCVKCGACCGSFRVFFYWREAEKESPHPVPIELTEDVDEFKRCMKGTNKKSRPACVALNGRIGNGAICSIYENRPSPCRAFQASFSEGRQNRRCDEARIAHGLKPLRREDWGKE